MVNTTNRGPIENEYLEEAEAAVRQEEIRVQAKIDLIRSYKVIFEDSADGRAVLEDLKKSCYFYKTHDGNSIMEGRRSVVCTILDILNTKEEKILALLKPQTQDEGDIY